MAAEDPNEFKRRKTMHSFFEKVDREVVILAAKLDVILHTKALLMEQQAEFLKSFAEVCCTKSERGAAVAQVLAKDASMMANHRLMSDISGVIDKMFSGIDDNKPDVKQMQHMADCAKEAIEAQQAADRADMEAMDPDQLMEEYMKFRARASNASSGSMAAVASNGASGSSASFIAPGPPPNNGAAATLSSSPPAISSPMRPGANTSYLGAGCQRLWTTYSDRDICRSNGARWDADAKVWFVPADATNANRDFLLLHFGRPPVPSSPKK